jgi:hypothetical protein
MGLMNMLWNGSEEDKDFRSECEADVKMGDRDTD